MGQHGVNQYHNKFSYHGVSWETSYISWPTIHGIVFDNLALLDDVFFVRFGVMFNVKGQNIPSWGESLLSVVHVYLTQLRAVKNTSRRVAEYTNTTGVRLVLASDLIEEISP